MSPMNDWLLKKLLSFLATKEGCTIHEVQSDSTAEFIDVFGYRYQIQIKALSRNSPDFDTDTKFKGVFASSKTTFLR